MTADRSAGRLLRFYPKGWRVRYGEELRALIVDMSDGGRVAWRMRADVATAGVRERLRGGGIGDARGGGRLVLWAWALFVLAGAIVAKSSEHWQSELPAGGHAAATAAFTALVAIAIAASVLVLAGIALAVPSLVAFLRAGGWPRVRAPILAAGALTVALGAATVALAAWAHGLTPRARNGHDALYGAAFLTWVALAAASLLAWTRAATFTADQLSLSPTTLQLHARLARAVAFAMATMTAATIVWWAVVASSPAALTGGPPSSHASAAVPSLIVAVIVMLLATGLGGVGARRAAAS